MIGIIQMNPTVGDVEGNCDKIIRAVKRLKASLTITPELATTGYPPHDLLLNNEFIKAVLRCNKRIARATRKSLILGTVTLEDNKLYNSALFCNRGKIVSYYHKRILKTKPYFDDQRYFQPGNESGLVSVGRERFGVIFYDEIGRFTPNYNVDCFLVLGSDPYFIDSDRIRTLQRFSRRVKNRIIFVNLVGGQDQLVFDGNSLVLDGRGRIINQLPAFGAVNELIMTRGIKPLNKSERLLHALITGIRDYVSKNGFSKALIGLSGGIDSALTATLATLAVGPENVTAIIMPGPFSSESSFQDAKRLAHNLKIQTMTIDIEPIYRAYLSTLNGIFQETRFGIAEENIQARIRGNILMALSNKFGHLVLSTGNRSESALGYATLYGDLAGGFSPISDLYKREVYRLARYINMRFKREIILKAIIKKTPSAELRPDQKDEDDLPPYHLLDPILQSLINCNFNYQAVVRKGFDKKVTQQILRLIQRSEFKRRQAPIGIKIHKKTFGLNIRMPVTMRWK